MGDVGMSGAAACAGATVDYRAVDVTDAAALEACVQDVLAQHGRIDGVIHSAGTLQDSFLLRKDPAQFNSVLAPKVAGLVELDQATAGLALDFFVAFSSLAAVYGNVGQGDYAAANGFMDRFSAWRQREVAQGRRYGVSLSLNWPLWAEGGMRVDPAVAAAMRTEFSLEKPKAASAEAQRKQGQREAAAGAKAAIADKAKAIAAELGDSPDPQALMAKAAEVVKTDPVLGAAVTDLAVAAHKAATDAAIKAAKEAAKDLQDKVGKVAKATTDVTALRTALDVMAAGPQQMAVISAILAADDATLARVARLLSVPGFDKATGSKGKGKDKAHPAHNTGAKAATAMADALTKAGVAPL